MNNMDLKDKFEEAVEHLVEHFSDASELKDMLCEKLDDVINYSFDGVDNAVYVASDNPTQEEELYAMRKHIKDEAVSRIAEAYMVTKVFARAPKNK